MSALSSIPEPIKRKKGFLRFAHPTEFLNLSQKLQLWITLGALILIVYGMGWALFFSPADWQQGDSVRIMYIHVPMAWLASMGYVAIAVCSCLSLVWRHPLADLAAKEMSPVGAIAAGLCLISGSLWGKPMWGTWWVWDARLTSMLILFFLYLGHIVLMNAFDNPQKSYRSAAILALIGVIDLPIIKFSVQWWNTLHQPNSITLTGSPTMSYTMLWPLLICFLGFSLGFVALIMARVHAAILEHRIKTQILNYTLQHTQQNHIG
ncbi:heme ABC transporter permease [Entomobacter blattae]|uniref:Heme exporter protein C n=1 Tax=Entomobacter blattae TaxID=2762277 RepID=A0A7H1NTG9_9PROT|nr:heme ABC transporter permease [Entomobacter blattae]QNT79079.1 Heme exporter protein C [Entomobacter blattae]